MTEPVREWIKKAEEDYRVALAISRARRLAAYGSVCFHAQQCIEKYLKAILEEHKAEIRRIHALQMLLADCLIWYPALSVLRPDMIALSEFAVEFRYPGENASVEDAKRAVLIMKRCRALLRAVLNLKRSPRT